MLNSYVEIALEIKVYEMPMSVLCWEQSEETEAWEIVKILI
jgi:hypothetical protein